MNWNIECYHCRKQVNAGKVYWHYQICAERAAFEARVKEKK